jgi:Protein of unknown function (DUF1572)
MSPSLDNRFLESTVKIFQLYKKLGEGAMAQLSDEEVMRKPNEASNSIALIVHHISGNMLSRWTDFLTTDGEKPWRDRDAEFEVGYPSKAAMMDAWEKGWACLFNALAGLKGDDLLKIVYIRNEGQTVMETIQRQLAHYPHHVGQILYQAKALKGDTFQSLSIPKGKSREVNQEKFSQEKEIRHFTDRP